MFAALAKLIPFRDYAYAALAAAAIIWYNVHVTDLEHHYAADKVAAVVSADAAATKKANDAAAVVIAADRASYTASLQKAQEAFDANTQATAAANTADLARLRQLAAKGNSHRDVVLGSTSGPGAPADSGQLRADTLGGVYVGAGVCSNLAAALRSAQDDLTRAYAERDSLTGK